MRFILDKEFVGHDIEVTMEMKALISLAAVELTFGFESFLIPYLHTIHVSPDIFYSRLASSHVKGLTFETGRMYLSWKSVQEGIDDKTDGLHVALHEMAHALKIDTVKGSPTKERFPFYLNTWMRFAKQVMAKEQQSGFLRAYAWVNLHEFLAVCLENFIERPKEFYKAEPTLFAHTCYLMNQFPLEPANRELNLNALRALSKYTGVQFPGAKEKDYTHHSWHWSLTMLLVSMLVSPIFIGALTYETVLPLGGFWSWMLCSAIAGFVFYRPVVKYKAMDMQMYLAFLFLGAGPAFFSAGLLLDRIIPVYSWNESYHVVRVHAMFDSPDVILTLEDNALSEWPYARTFTNDYYHYLKEDTAAVLEVEFERGILGGKRVESHRLKFSKVFR